MNRDEPTLSQGFLFFVSFVPSWQSFASNLYRLRKKLKIMSATMM